jgi:hypothetical protein
MTTLASFTLADGAWIFLGFCVAALLALAYGYYTKRGSAINQRPHGSVYSGAPGARMPSVLSHDRSAASRLFRRRDKVEPEQSGSEKEPARPPRKRRRAKHD